MHRAGAGDRVGDGLDWVGGNPAVIARQDFPSLKSVVVKMFEKAKTKLLKKVSSRA